MKDIEKSIPAIADNEKSLSVKVDWSEAEEKQLRRKFDLCILPLVTIFMVQAYVNRINIGNAKIANKEKEHSLLQTLNMDSGKFATAVSCFFWSYLVFQVPLNLLFKRIKPAYWASVCLMLWGIAATSTGLVTNYAQLLVCRVITGLGQSGFVPASVSYLSKWYKPSEQGFRLAVFFASSSIAGAASGFLAFYISKLDEKQNMRGWQWIFVLEGLPTIFLAFIALFFLPNSVSSAKFLCPRQKEIAASRIPEPATEAFEWKQVSLAVFNFRMWLFCLLGATLMIPNYSFSFFAPSQIANMGFPTRFSQFLSALPYIVAMFVAPLVSWNSDRMGDRKWHLSVAFVIEIICLFLLGLVLENQIIKVIVTGIAINAAACTLPLALAWNAEFIAPYSSSYKLASVALMLSTTNASGVISPFIYSFMGASGAVRRDRGISAQEEAGHCIVGSSVLIALAVIWVIHFKFVRSA